MRRLVLYLRVGRGGGPFLEPLLHRDLYPLRIYHDLLW
jgi:hypothetical protein